MNNKWMVVGAVLAMSVNSALADMVCEAKTSNGDAVSVTVRLSNNNPAVAQAVEIQVPALGSQKTYSVINQADDGSRILLSAPGLMIAVNYWYGCFRNAQIISDAQGYGQRFLESLNVATCTGGSTDDALCLGSSR